MDVIDVLLSQGKLNLVWVCIIVQALAYLLKWKLKDRFSGLIRFASIYVTTAALGTIVLWWSGVDLKKAFAVANWLAQAQVSAHQVYKTSREKLK